MMLQQFKARLVGAQKGWKLLKKKRDALKARFSAMLKEIVETKRQVAIGLKDAGFSYAKAQWANAGDDFSSTVIEKAKDPSVTARLTADNVAGVRLPTFKMSHDPSKDTSVGTIGLAQGGAVINACRETHLKALQQLINLASLQTSFVTLDEEIKMTGRRVNALEYVIIPRIADICAYINQEMDEQAREEFFRVKKVVEKKRQKMEREKEEEMAQAAKDEATSGRKKPAAKAASAPASMLEADKDPDVIF